MVLNTITLAVVVSVPRAVNLPVVCYKFIQQYQPEEAAIEQVFMHKNASSALKLGHARGAAIIAVAEHIDVVAEYSARQIKQAVIGYGAVEKIQVQQMVRRLLNLNEIPQTDAADALAVALCHANSRDMLRLLAGEEGK